MRLKACMEASFAESRRARWVVAIFLFERGGVISRVEHRLLCRLPAAELNRCLSTPVQPLREICLFELPARLILR